MSTKTSIIATDIGEHWYTDCFEPTVDNQNKDVITMEFDPKNAKVSVNMGAGTIELKLIMSDSEVYKLIEQLKQFVK